MNKRKIISHDGGNPYDEIQEIVDDLAFAATFATAYVTSTSTFSTSTNEDEPQSTFDSKMEEEMVENIANAGIKMGVTDINQNHESDNDSDDDTDSKGESRTRDEKEETNGNNQDDDDDSDDESDVDLTTFLTQMQEEEDKDPSTSFQKNTMAKNKTPTATTSASTSTNILKTQNELDLYNCPIEDLEKLDILDLNINTHDENKNEITSDQIKIIGSERETNVITFQKSNNDYGIMNATIQTNRLVQVSKMHISIQFIIKLVSPFHFTQKKT